MSLDRNEASARYETRESIGRGGQGRVYRGIDPVLQRDVAIKRIDASASDDPEVVEALRREAQFAAQLNHPNVVTVLDFDIHNDAPIIVMELVPDSLSKRLESNGAMAYEDAIGVAIQVCRGLAHAHDKLVLHRDLKPQNILITPDGTPKICDFGLARALGEARGYASLSTVGFGTAKYMSPEHWDSYQITAAADIYSMGITLFEMLTGEVPFKGPSLPEYINQHKEAPVPPFKPQLNIPYAVELVVRRALEKDPEDRFASADDMAKDLEAARMTAFISSLQNTSDPDEADEPEEEEWEGPIKFTGSIVSEHPNVVRYRFRHRGDNFDLYVPNLLIDAYAEIVIENPESLTVTLQGNDSGATSRPDPKDDLWGYDFFQEHGSSIQYQVIAYDYQEQRDERYRLYVPKAIFGAQVYPERISLTVEWDFVP